ncbi:hypothetical protein NPIL_171341, partial [Nephila pilipes]
MQIQNSVYFCFFEQCGGTKILWGREAPVWILFGFSREENQSA